MNYRVELSQFACDAIYEYVRFIAIERQSPLSAERWLQKIWQAVDSLETLPHRCPLAPENEHRQYEIRMRVVGDYLLLYTVDEAAKTVQIIGFRHGHRLPRPSELPQDSR
jgi:plasmid stabilization system protein ParE